MTEYDLIRAVLGFALLWLFRQKIPASLRNYALLMGCYQLVPQALNSPIWSRYFWWPISVAQLILGWIVCVELFDIQTRHRTFWNERVLVALSGLAAGVGFACLAWSWHPENVLQGWTIINQYCWMLFFVAWTWVSFRFGILRPLLRIETDSFAKFWLVWCACHFFRNTTGRTGLFWILFHKSVVTYRIVNDLGMIVQLCAVLYLCLKGKQYARRERESRTSSTAHGYTAA